MQDERSRRSLRARMPWLESIRQRKRQQNGVGSRWRRSQKVVGARIYVYASRANRLLIRGKADCAVAPKGRRKAHSVIRLTLQGDFASRAEDVHRTCHTTLKA